MENKEAASADRQNKTTEVDFIEAKKFLQVLDPSGRFTFQTFSEGQRKNGCPLTRILHGTFEEHKETLIFLNRSGAGIFVTVGRTDGSGRKKENITGIRAVFLDLDGVPLPEEWPLKPHLIIESSPGKYHAYWWVESGFPMDQFESTQKAIAAKFNGDKAVCDLPRVMRIPGFFHQKKESFLSHIIRDCSQEPRYTINQILEAFPSVKTPPKNQTVAPIIHMEDPILQILMDKEMVIRQDQLEKGKYIIQCPWSVDHTNDDPDSAFWLPNYGGYTGYGFKCLHSHCVDRSIKDLREFLGVDQEAPWDEPEPLPEELLPVLQFKYDFLPVSFRDWIRDTSERMQCPRDFAGVGAVIALAAVVGRKIGIRPKKYDDWLVVPNLYGGVVGHPGLLKTPVLEEVMIPLKRLASSSRESFKKVSEEWETQKSVRDVKEKAFLEQMHKATNTGKNTEDIEAKLLSLKKESTPPVEHRYIVNDPTIESLQKILSENPMGVLLYRDELSGWFRLMDRQGRENDRGFYLEAWPGTGSYTSDRIGRGKTHIQSVCLSILGGIQPGPLSKYVNEASLNGAGQDGLLQRFQLLVWPDPPGDWEHVDRAPNKQARNKAYDVFQRLNALDPVAIGAETEEEGGIPFLRFDGDAQPVFDTWHENLETKKLRSGEDPMIVAALAKYRSLIPSLALLIHLADDGTGPVGKISLLRAIQWGDYLESHMRRIYRGMDAPCFSSARSLLKKIHEGEIRDGMTLREIARKGWSGLDRGSLSATLKILDQYNWARLETIKPPTGRKSEVLRINPEAMKNETHPKPEENSFVSFGTLSGGGTIFGDRPEGQEKEEKGGGKMRYPPPNMVPKLTKGMEEEKLPPLSLPSHKDSLTESAESGSSLSAFRRTINAAAARQRGAWEATPPPPKPTDFVYRIRTYADVMRHMSEAEREN